MALRSSTCVGRRHPLGTLIIAVLAICIFLIWYGMNSDKDNIPPVLTQLIPAGHCTCATSTSFNCSSCLESISQVKPETSLSTWTFQSDRDKNNISLNRRQCGVSFPGLFEDINRATGFWEKGVSAADISKIQLQNGMAKARIHNGELYVINTRSAQEDHRRKILAILSSIHRALSAHPNTDIPWNFDFVFSVEDRVQDIGGRDHPIWVLGRKAKEQAVWLMPDFGFWAWENLSNSLGPYSQVVEHIKAREPSWDQKIPKLVWRGKLSFAPKLRRNLLDAARNRPWGDVKELIWSRKDNFISMEDHCKYMFLAHTEGRSFSSSLKYRQACRSVIVAHKLQYIQHHHYLLQADGPYQNFVEVERDFSDLSNKIEGLLKDPERARRIADNSVAVFQRRYLTKAAEACYWRAMWDGWAKVSAPAMGEKGYLFDLENPSISAPKTYLNNHINSRHNQSIIIIMAAVEIPKQAKAAVYDKPGTVSTKVELVDVPEPGPGEVLINLTHSGVCHSDFGIMTNGWARLPYKTPVGQVGGHEGVGKIVKLGPSSESSGLKVGDRVGVKWIGYACGSCTPCFEGVDAACINKKVSGYFTPGTFQQYIVGPAHYVTPIPDGLDSAAAAPMLCAGVTVYSALKRSGARPGQWVVITGAGGGLGHIATQLSSRGFGHRVIAIDHGSKEDIVMESGAEIFLDVTKYPSASPEDLAALSAKIKSLTGGLGAHAVIVCAAANTAYAQAVRMLRFNGVVVCVGIPEGNAVPIATAVAAEMITQQLSIVGSAVGNRQDAIETMDFAARGVIKTHFRVEKMDKLTEVFEQMGRGELKGRVVLDLS
ncbi:hypothetical protein FQN57_004636 [Myotisia sp. PD_48]|nr:hypothetical protein FQN57_004636 [Myotisia sp. PD_48]